MVPEFVPFVEVLFIEVLLGDVIKFCMIVAGQDGAGEDDIEL